MHGAVDHHPRPYDFSVDTLTNDQRAVVQEVIVRYLVTGFADPGLGVFSSEAHETIRREAAVRMDAAKLGILRHARRPGPRS